MIDYIVRVPSAPYESENCRQDLDRAYDICYSLSEEFGYAEIIYFDIHGHQHHVGDYGSKVS